jgi:hypothetical protein
MGVKGASSNPRTASEVTANFCLSGFASAMRRSQGLNDANDRERVQGLARSTSTVRGASLNPRTAGEVTANFCRSGFASAMQKSRTLHQVNTAVLCKRS